MADERSLKFLSNFQKVKCACDTTREVTKAKSKDVFLIQVPSKVGKLNKYQYKIAMRC